MLNQIKICKTKNHLNHRAKSEHPISKNNKNPKNLSFAEVLKNATNFIEPKNEKFVKTEIYPSNPLEQNVHLRKMALNALKNLQ